MRHPALLPEHGPVGRAFSDGAADGVTRLHEIMAKERTALDGTGRHFARTETVIPTGSTISIRPKHGTFYDGTAALNI
jgi:hypothetical protein